MFIANFSLKTSIQKFLFTVRDFHDFPTLHPAHEMKVMALRESVEYAEKNMRRAVGGESSREGLAMGLEQVSVDGHYLEFGVFEGGTIGFIGGKVGKQKAAHGFDRVEAVRRSWRGAPAPSDA